MLSHLPINKQALYCIHVYTYICHRCRQARANVLASLTTGNSSMPSQAAMFLFYVSSVLENTIMEPASKLLLKRGSPLYLKCAVTANPAPQWTWLKDGVVTQSEGSFLKKKALDIADTGRYVCVAKNRKGKQAAAQDVLVLGNCISFALSVI